MIRFSFFFLDVMMLIIFIQKKKEKSVVNKVQTIVEGLFIGDDAELAFTAEMVQQQEEEVFFKKYSANSKNVSLFFSTRKRLSVLQNI